MARDPCRATPGFPGKIALSTVLAMTGLYYFTIFIVPSMPRGQAASPSLWILDVGLFAEAHPILFGSAFLFLLVPALFSFDLARTYLTRLVMLLTLVWAVVLVSACHPEIHASKAVDSMLYAEREFLPPDPP